MQNETRITEAPKLRPFDKQDYSAFAGVVHTQPQIEFSNECAVVQDGKKLEVHDHQGNGWTMQLPSFRAAEIIGNCTLSVLVHEEQVAAKAGQDPDFFMLMAEFGFTPLDQ